MASRRADETNSLGGGARDRLPSADLPDEIAVKRSDPIYNAHAYLTKVPVTAIEPFIEAFTSKGDTVLDMYGGSGMTGIAAAILGRRAEIRDISLLGRHIGSNYLNLVEAAPFRAAAQEAVASTKLRLGDVYAARCGGCGSQATLSRTVWSYVYECKSCEASVNYYESFRAAKWKKTKMKCSGCGAAFVARGLKRIAETPVLDTVACTCSSKLIDCPHESPPNSVPENRSSWPGVPIDENRQMFQASALRKHGLLKTDSFFSVRNFAVLSALRGEIEAVECESIRSKLLFAFTAILTRASKRYQWHPKRPLNAANHNYYIAPVFYEWNVYDLFTRKVEAAVRSDTYIRARMDAGDVSRVAGFNYEVGSADSLDLENESVDYVFTDPPFGSNIYYSDMNLFQEAWLGDFTDHAREAVVDRTSGKRSRSAERYEALIADSLCEASRVLRSGGWLSLVFSNSNGEMWALLQRAISKAGFTVGDVALLNKGQRSVKGLASGFENVVTVDLIISMQKNEAKGSSDPPSAPGRSLETLVDEILEREALATPSHLYLLMIRRYLQEGWDLSNLHIRDVVKALKRAEFGVDEASGRLVRLKQAA